MESEKIIEEAYEIAMNIISWAINDQKFTGEDLYSVLGENITKEFEELKEKYKNK